MRRPYSSKYKQYHPVRGQRFNLRDDNVFERESILDEFLQNNQISVVLDNWPSPGGFEVFDDKVDRIRINPNQLRWLSRGEVKVQWREVRNVFAVDMNDFFVEEHFLSSKSKLLPNISIHCVFEMDGGLDGGWVEEMDVLLVKQFHVSIVFLHQDIPSLLMRQANEPVNHFRRIFNDQLTFVT